MSIFNVLPFIILGACMVQAWFVNFYYDRHIWAGSLLIGIASLCLYYIVIYSGLSIFTKLMPGKKACWALGAPIGIFLALLPMSFSGSSGFISMKIHMANIWIIPGAIILQPVMNGRTEKLQAEQEEAAYNATPDPGSNNIIAIIKSPYLQVELKDIAGLPGGRILLSSDVTGPKSSTKLSVFSPDGKLDPDFTIYNERAEHLRYELITALNGNFLLISDVFLSGWNEDEPAALRNRHGKTIGTLPIILKVGSRIYGLRFVQDGRLYGIERMESGGNLLEINLVELPLDGNDLCLKANLLPVLKKTRGFNALTFLPQDLFFWPNGDLGLIVLERENRFKSFVIRMDPEGKHVKSFFVVGSGLKRFIGFLPDNSLLLGGKDYNREKMSQYKDGKEVTSFSEAVKKIGKRFEIQASGMISPDKIAIAGRRLDKKNIFEFVIIDPDGKEIHNFHLGK